MSNQVTSQTSNRSPLKKNQKAFLVDGANDINTRNLKTKNGIAFSVARVSGEISKRILIPNFTLDSNQLKEVGLFLNRLFISVEIVKSPTITRASTNASCFSTREKSVQFDYN